MDRNQPPAHGAVAFPVAGPGVNASERVKELDFEQRSRLHGVARVTLSLGFLRASWRRIWTRTRLAASAPVPRPPAGTLALTFVGHASVMITTPGARILTDPVLENRVCGVKRARACAIDAQDLADVDLVLISHAGRDHLSRHSLARLARTAIVIVPPRCAALVGDLGFARVVELGTGQSFSHADVEVIAMPAHHPGGRGLFGRKHAGANGYVVRAHGRTVYFAGDTGYFPGFAEIGRRFDPDVALLPIGGYQPAPFRQEHLSPLDAVYAFQDLGARNLIPVAHGSFAFSYEPLAEPLTWLRELAEEKKLTPALTILDHGQTCLLR